ncbi:MAG: BLUF domain-containing protein [Arenimonas sp.]|uniref:BLUF domain-containing protein n=1 Tax=Arenimonas sp. TaxID=1872635 RepID=UPI0025B8A59F|nr:BLUF domain-containing protein [Arenimonas sp.]MBW8366662.1 BLUF domain-containing protein [Arenimonas sp.]
MPQLLRLTYASRATFPLNRFTSGIQSEVARIMVQSRRNNPRQQLVGALYFGDGCFFQCLEGPEAAVEALYQRLHGDPRHTDLRVLARENVSSTRFSNWAMKLVPNAAEVQALMVRHGRTTFDPYSFDDSLRQATVELLLRGADAALPPVPEEPRRSPPMPPGVKLAIALGAVGAVLGALSLALHFLP